MTKIRNALIGGAGGFILGITALGGMWPITTFILGGLGYMLGNTKSEEMKMREYQRRYKQGMGGL